MSQTHALKILGLHLGKNLAATMVQSGDSLSVTHISMSEKRALRSATVMMYRI
eukprot:COSAG01_NODE_2400_length_7761_cov_120.247194_7_plen_53_part_00